MFFAAFFKQSVFLAGTLISSNRGRLYDNGSLQFLKPMASDFPCNSFGAFSLSFPEKF